MNNWLKFSADTFHFSLKAPCKAADINNFSLKTGGKNFHPFISVWKHSATLKTLIISVCRQSARIFSLSFQFESTLQRWRHQLFQFESLVQCCGHLSFMNNWVNFFCRKKYQAMISQKTFVESK